MERGRLMTVERIRLLLETREIRVTSLAKHTLKVFLWNITGLLYQNLWTQTNKNMSQTFEVSNVIQSIDHPGICGIS